MWLCGSTLHLNTIYCILIRSLYIYIYVHSLLFQGETTKSAMFWTFIYPFSFYITDIKDDHFQQHDQKCWSKDSARWKEGHVKTLNWRVQNRCFPQKSCKEFAPKNWCLEEDVLLTWHVFRWLSFIFEGRRGSISGFHQNNSHFQESCQLLRPTSLAYIPTVIVRSSWWFSVLDGTICWYVDHFIIKSCIN